MTTFGSASPTFTLPIQPEKRFRSGDRIWIVTDTFEYCSSYLNYSTEQLWYRVGAVDLSTNGLGYFKFGIDGARAIVNAGLPPPSWGNPLLKGIALSRAPHENGASGRFPERVALVDIEPDLFALGAVARKKFLEAGHSPNSKPGMWQDMVDHFQLQTSIATTALSMVGEFSACDLKKALGKDVNVSPVLGKLVREERLTRTGKKRSARYRVAAPVIPTRVDWAR